MDTPNSQPNETETWSLSVGDEVESRVSVCRFRRRGTIIDVFDHGVVMVKWDLLQSPERMREQSLIKKELHAQEANH